jgi:hypothetical protein
LTLQLACLTITGNGIAPQIGPGTRRLLPRPRGCGAGAMLSNPSRKKTRKFRTLVKVTPSNTILRSLTWGVVVLAAIIAFEVGSNYLFYLEHYKLFYAPDLIRQREAAVAAHAAPGVTTKLHPYYGFVQAYSAQAMQTAGLIENNYGFPQYRTYAQVPGCCDFPFPAEQRKRMFVIGLFGNSIAHGIGDYFQVLPAVLYRFKSVPQVAGKQIVVLNLAVGGHHSPQALDILTNLLAIGMTFDVVLNVSTAEELVGTSQNVKKGIALDYPTNSLWVPMTSLLDRQAGSGFWETLSFALERGSVEGQRYMDRCPVVSCLMVLRPATQMLKAASALWSPSSQPDHDPVHFFTARPRQDSPASEDARFAESGALWRRSVSLMAALSAASGGVFVNALLPSPWDHPSGVAPFSLRPDTVTETQAMARKSLALMRAETIDLKANGIHEFDATRVLDTMPVDSSTYLDEYGHFGQLGLKIVSEFLINSTETALFRTAEKSSIAGSRSDASSAASAVAESAQSQESPFAAWSPKGVKLYGGAGTAPDSSDTATKLVEDISAGSREITATLNLDDLAKPVLAHVYAHAGENRRLLFFLESGGELVVRCDVDLDTGKATFQTETSFPSQECKTIPENAGWWRVQLSGRFDRSHAKGEKRLGIAPTSEPFKREYPGNGHSHIMIWNAGVDTPESYKAASASPSPAAVSASTPPASEFANWRIEGASLGGGIVAPDGTPTATKLSEDTTLGFHGPSAIINIDVSKPVSASISARAGSGRRLLLFISSGANRISCDIDLTSGKVAMKGAGSGQPSNCAATAEGMGWWRVSLSGLLGGGIASDETVLGIAATTEPFAEAYQGDGKGNLLVWKPAVSQLIQAGSDDKDQR